MFGFAIVQVAESGGEWVAIKPTPLPGVLEVLKRWWGNAH